MGLRHKEMNFKFSLGQVQKGGGGKNLAEGPKRIQARVLVKGDIKLDLGTKFSLFILYVLYLRKIIYFLVNFKVLLIWSSKL